MLLVPAVQGLHGSNVPTSGSRRAADELLSHVPSRARRALICRADKITPIPPRGAWGTVSAMS